MPEFIEEILIDCVRSIPDEIAFSTTSAKWSYSNVLVNSLKIANLLKKLKVSKEEKIGIYFDNNEEFIFSMFGILLIGGIVVPIPFHSKAQEISALIKNCDIKVCLCKNKPAEVNGYWINTSTIDFYNTDINLVLKDKDYTAKSSDAAFFLSTSGSTGTPKVIMLSHQNIISNTIAHSIQVAFKRNDLFLITMPLHFSSTITTQILSCIYLKVPFLLVSVPMLPKVFFNIAESFNVSCLAAVPTFLSVLVRDNLNSVFFNKVHTLIISGSAIQNNMMEKIKLLFPNVDVLHTYGLTEASPRVTIMKRGEEKISCGFPVPGVDVEIVDKSGSTLINNSIGEIKVKGKNIMLGYYKNEYLTNTNIVNGWLLTGDLGYFDSDGRLFVVGRIKNLILTGGINVYPEEVEEFFYGINGIEEALVLGEPDEIMGEIITAHLVINDQITLNEIKNITFRALSNYKNPRKWYLHDSLPKTLTGKIKRNQFN
ncbi:class I adenylate-forming enzyme family protein [Cohnella sp. GCM10020058]|uniref:class I adenylate-forming enzyme family protein n=1 Tax=Cohnella sp. GCM10020058 TaxID=3317330 RepID=UPI003644244E